MDRKKERKIDGWIIVVKKRFENSTGAAATVSCPVEAEQETVVLHLL